MKINCKFGLSYYTLDLDKSETARWKATKDLPKFDKKQVRREIIDDAFVRIKFGGYDNAIKALCGLDSDLKKFSSKISS